MIKHKKQYTFIVDYVVGIKIKHCTIKIDSNDKEYAIYLFKIYHDDYDFIVRIKEKDDET